MSQFMPPTLVADASIHDTVTRRESPWHSGMHGIERTQSNDARCRTGLLVLSSISSLIDSKARISCHRYTCSAFADKHPCSTESEDDDENSFDPEADLF
ncbi:hypothetical protein VTL71DRAFT_12549 [Oculimacula yallundae]|uniref:Uncharacterized protein n=1 Tax=Oculimacula yallundae TaxID=86028 RepID=A0ABR4CQJ1_9HELO